MAAPEGGVYFLILRRKILRIVTAVRRPNFREPADVIDWNHL
jgi:hypothetical protein